MARRLVERGVRFVQIFAGGVGNQNTDTWDAHDDIKTNHTQHAAETDRPMAGLLTDLKARGLLDTTLVIMHSEFGRMPISQRGVGRDHNPGAQTVLMAGAGIKGGQVIGSTDEFGYKAMEQPISYHDLHATMLHLLGLDHTKLTYRFNGRDMRLTDVRHADSADREDLSGASPPPHLHSTLASSSLTGCNVVEVGVAFRLACLTVPTLERTPFLEQARAATDLLERLAADWRLLDQLPADDRRRLHQAIAGLSDRRSAREPETAVRPRKPTASGRKKRS